MVLSSKENKALPGTTVRLEGSKTSTITDGGGNFILRLTVPADKLIISHIGYETESLPVSTTSNPLVIHLRNAPAQLQEVIVSTGYQNIPRERSTGSFEQITNEQLNQRITPDIISRLKGVSSIFFDTKNTRPPITIRGLSTINGPQAPLIIVDNFPYEGNINNINPNDVESITILKDAAAASIWGTRAGNGVIVITTKHGKFNQPLKIDFTTNLTFTQKPTLNDFHPMSSSDFISMEESLYSKGYYSNQINNRYKPPLSPIVELLLKESNGRISEADAEAQINALKKIDVRDDFEKYIYQTGLSQQYALSLSGGTSKTTYEVSGGYDESTDVLAAQSDRVSLRAVNVFKPINNLSISTGLLYTSVESKTGRPPYNSIYIGSKQLYPYAQLAGKNGEPLPFYKYNENYIDTAGGGKLLDWKYYPLEDWRHNYTTVNTGDILANLDINYRFLSHFSIDLKYQFEKQTVESDHLQDLQSYYARDLINQFSQIDYASGTVNYIVPKGGIMDKTAQSLRSQSGRLQLNYDNTWGKNNLYAIAGGELREILNNSDAHRIYGYNGNILSEASVDYVNAYPNSIYGYSTFIPDMSGLSSMLNHYVSVYANAAYTYDLRYTLSASVRRDASNLFGVTTNDKWTPLWSAGGSWNISNEAFYHSSLLPFLKVRVTYGFSGNVDQSKSAVTTVSVGHTARYTNLPDGYISQYDNPSLRWEKVGMLNIGIDFSTRENILQGSIEYYHKKGLDLFGPAPVDYTAIPVATLMKNVANMAGNGMEVTLNANIINKSFKWTSSLIFSSNKTKITKYFLTSVTASNFVSGGSVIDPIQGKPVYSIMSYKWAGLDPQTGNPQGILNGKTSEDYTSLYYDSVQNLVYSGPAIPTIFGYFNNTFSWKGLSITPCISYKFGYYFRKQSISYSDLYTSWAANSDFAKRWQKPGDEKTTYVPSMIYPAVSKRDGFYDNSEVLVRKADNIRLEYVNITYNIKAAALRKSFFNEFQVYMIASNLGILWRANKEGLDPDYDNSVPPSKMITLGVRTSF